MDLAVGGRNPEVVGVYVAPWVSRLPEMFLGPDPAPAVGSTAAATFGSLAAKASIAAGQLDISMTSGSSAHQLVTGHGWAV